MSDWMNEIFGWGLTSKIGGGGDVTYVTCEAHVNIPENMC